MAEFFGYASLQEADRVDSFERFFKKSPNRATSPPEISQAGFSEWVLPGPLFSLGLPRPFFKIAVPDNIVCNFRSWGDSVMSQFV